MASIYKLEPEKLFTVPSDDRVTECKLCWEIAQPDDGIDLGPLYQYGRLVADKTALSNETEGENTQMEIYCAHYFCLLFSSGLTQRGEVDENGIKGFLPEDILKEWRRGARLKCTRCNKKYATIGCSAKKTCRRSYHLPCAIRDKALLQFCAEFRLYCSDHRLRQAVYYCNDDENKDDGRECGICSDDLPKITEQNLEEQMDNVWSPCCNKWFHKDCVQQFARNSGYFFKCPLCNNKDVFETEMKAFGVYVPEQDAAWETQDDGALFDDLLERHNTCDAEECICPEGREADEDYTIWEIILCWLCGAQGIHVKCGDLPLSTDVVKWKCKDCIETIKKMPKRTKHNFQRVQRNKKSTSKLFLKNALKNTRINVEKSDDPSTSDVLSRVTFDVEDKGFCASFNLCPKYDIPLPVKISSEPWLEEGEANINQLKTEARTKTPIVELERMELIDAQYSVYTIWSPPSDRLESNTLTPSTPSNKSNRKHAVLHTPRAPSRSHFVESSAILRSPSVPKSTVKLQLVQASSPSRSQSLPPNFTPSDSVTSSQPQTFKMERKHVGPPSSLTLTQAPHSPMKAKFNEKIQQKEALVALKKFGGALGKSSRITPEIRDITGNKGFDKFERKLKRKSNKEKFTELKEGQDENTAAKRTQLLAEKRKYQFNETDNPYKKKRIKRQNKEKWVVSKNCLDTSARSDNGIENTMKSNTLQNAEKARSENINPTSNQTTAFSPKDNSKTQRSILQYFNVQ